MNYINKKFTALAISVLLSSVLSSNIFAQDSKNRFTLTGTITGKQPENVVLKYNRGNETVVADTSTVKNGKFVFTGEVSEPIIASINLFNQMIWLEPAEMNIEINTDLSTYKLTGSKTQRDQDAYYRKLDSIVAVFRTLTGEIGVLKERADTTTDPTLKKQLMIKHDSLTAQLSRKQLKSSDLQMGYIRENPHSFFSGMLLFPLNSSEVIPLDTAITLYEKLAPRVQQSFWGKKINADLSLLKQNRIGEPAPDFEAYDPIRQSVLRLSDLRGKVVLLDFWAPWCGPCRRGFKYLKPLHNTYAAKGFEVVAIYTDKQEDQESWLKAIKDEDIGAWHQVKIADNMLPDKATHKDIRSKYYVQAIPRKLLVDRQGNIVKIWVGVSGNVEKDVEETVKKLMAE